MKMEWLGITMLIDDKGRLKRNVEQIGYKVALYLSYLHIKFDDHDLRISSINQLH